MATAIAKPSRRRAPMSAVRAATTGGSSLVSLYEAGSSTRRTIGWRAPTTSPNQALASLATIRDRSRAACRNNGIAAGIIQTLTTNVVGIGIKPLSTARDKDFRRRVQELWLRWTDESDATGALDYYGQQAQAVRCWLEAGEVFVRIRSRMPGDKRPDMARPLSVPIQIEVLEPEMCPHTYTGAAAPRTGNPIKAGIEFDKIGRRVAYWFYASRPGDPEDWREGDLRRVPADRVAHIYNPLRAGQLRGVPHLAQALVKLNELDKFDDATLLRQQIGNLFAGFVHRPVSDYAGVLPMTGLAADGTTDEGRPILSLEPGIFQELAPGETVDFSKPPDPPATYPAFVRQQLMAVGAAVGVPYEVITGDMSGLNDRVMRVLLGAFRRYIIATQHQILAYQMCRRVWDAWFNAAYLAQALPIPREYLDNPEAYAAWEGVRWMPQGWPYLHPVQDVQAAQAAILAGFTSRSAVVSEQGEDSESIDQEQADDNVRADELGLKYDSDGRKAAVAPAPFQSNDDERSSETPEDDADEGSGPEGDDEPPDPDKEEDA